MTASKTHPGISIVALISLVCSAASCRTAEKNSGSGEARNLATMAVEDFPLAPDAESLAERTPWLKTPAVVWDAPSGYRWYVSYLALTLADMQAFCAAQTAKPPRREILQRAIDEGLSRFLAPIQGRARTELRIWSLDTDLDFPEFTFLYSIGRRGFFAEKRRQAFALAACASLTP